MVWLLLLLTSCQVISGQGVSEEITAFIQPRVQQQVDYSTGVCSRGLSNLAKEGNCQYYDCLETSVQCTDRGYPLRHGKRYCNRLDNIKSSLSPKGQQWIDTLKRCLMLHLNGYLQNLIKSCQTMAEVAFHANLECLPGSSDASICHVINEPAHWGHLVGVFAGRGRDNDHVIHQVMQVARSCVQQNYNRAELGDRTRLTSNINDFLSQLKRHLPANSMSAKAVDSGRQSACEQYAQQGDCRFYECFHERFLCGSDAEPEHMLHFEMVTCQMLQTHSRLSPAAVAPSWAVEHQKCLMQKLLPTYRAGSVQCAHIQPFLFDERLDCLHSTQVATCRMNSDDLALMLDRVLDLESYPVATLQRMMYMSDADKEVLLPIYYFRQTALLRVQFGDALCVCRANAAGECQPLHMPVYNTQADTAQFVMDKRSQYSPGDPCGSAKGQCQLTGRACKGQYRADLCTGANNNMCCIPKHQDRPQICQSNGDNAIRGGPQCGGPGWWNAPRDWGRHQAIDILCNKSDEVLAPISGKLSLEGTANGSCQGVELRIGSKAEEAVSVKYVIPHQQKLFQLVQRGEPIGVLVSCNATCEIPSVTLTRWVQGKRVDPTPEYGGPVIDLTPTTTMQPAETTNASSVMFENSTSMYPDRSVTST